MFRSGRSHEIAQQGMLEVRSRPRQGLGSEEQSDLVVGLCTAVCGPPSRLLLQVA